MAKWNAVVLTCPSKNSSIAYQKELKLRQDKGLIDKDCLIICIEDPDGPIGSGGATLNAILVVAEALSAMKQFRMTQIETLKDTYILIMHMGRQYPFDIVGKAFSTIPFQDKLSNNLLNNFDLLYATMTNQIACLNSQASDPGIFVCSTDMLFVLPEFDKILIKDTSICVISSPTDELVASKNGIYEVDETNYVTNIYYQPNKKILNSLKGDKFNLVTGIVYFNYDVVQTLYSLLLFSPIDACSYIGIDSGASSLSLSLFFDILLATCTRLGKERYISGMFKTNLNVAKNKLEILKQARATLWDALQSFKIRNITVNENVKHVYMDNETYAHKMFVFNDHCSFSSINKQFKPFEIRSNGAKILHCLDESKNFETDAETKTNCFLINNIFEQTTMSYKSNVVILNCHFKSSHVDIGDNTILNDLSLVNETISFPSNFFIQSVDITNSIHFENETKLNIIFGINDNLVASFNETNWSIMNMKWVEFKSKFSIDENDLWPSDVDLNDRCLFNAKLYPLRNTNLAGQEVSRMSELFWIDILESNDRLHVPKWHQSIKYSIEDIFSMINLEKVFKTRRNLFNLINIQHLVSSVVLSKPIQFTSLIRNAIYDGYGYEILRLLDKAAYQNLNDLILLPRLTIFISNTLCEMALNYSSVRSGPSLNANWLNAFKLIDNGELRKAFDELIKERSNWMHRNDLLIRASRHYEGATLALIRQATSSFFSNTSQFNPIVLEAIDNKQKFEWVEAIAPARLDLAGAWSDTPPITYECPGGSCVTNVSILVNGVKPIGSRGRIIQTSSSNSVKIVMRNSSDINDISNLVCFEFNNLNDFRDYNKPQAIACLVKAVCVFTKLVEFNNESLNDQLKNKINGSLELHTWTGLPHGSGLGTSSILIGCVLKVVWYLMGIIVSNETLSYSILVVEQLMTTNGGWQDQVGAIWGGFKFTSAKNQLPLEMKIKQLSLRHEFIESVNQRLVLIYTGLTRLAKDLLLNVIRNWYSISSDIYDNVQELIKNGVRCAEALENEDIALLGECINKHRKQKLVMAPGSEPEFIKVLFEKAEPFVHGMALAGAGGGGFVYVLTKESTSKQLIKELIESLNLNMQIYDAMISNDGIEFRFN